MLEKQTSHSNDKIINSKTNGNFVNLNLYTQREDILQIPISIKYSIQSLWKKFSRKNLSCYVQGFCDHVVKSHSWHDIIAIWNWSLWWSTLPKKGARVWFIICSKLYERHWLDYILSISFMYRINLNHQMIVHLSKQELQYNQEIHSLTRNQVLSS